MARRYVPREQQLSPLSGLAHLLDTYTETQREKREREEEENALSLADALQTLELDRLGVREGTAPTRAVPRDQDIFADARPGMAADAAGRSDIGLSLEAARQMRPSELVKREPQVVHLPGSYIRGVGFTERALTDVDLAQLRKEGMRAEKQTADPRYRQLNEDYYLDTESTPDARERRGGAARQLQLLEAFRGMGATPQQLALLQADPDFADEVFDQLNEEAPAPPKIRVGGRDFPDDEVGQNAALAWQEALAEAGRRPDATGDGTRITGEVTRRTAAMAAARAVDRIREQTRELSPAERRNIEPGQIEQQIRSTLSLFGFGSVQELQEEMRTLRLSGVDSGRSPAAAGGGEIDDDEIDRLILENPDLTDEEIAEILRGGS